jgi:hypothetical protein
MNCWKPVDTKENTFLFLYLSPLAKRNPLTSPSSNRWNLSIFLKHFKTFKFSPNLIQVKFQIQIFPPFQSKHPSLDLNFSLLSISMASDDGENQKRIVMLSFWKKNITMLNGRKSSNLEKSHEVICHFIRLYLVPLLS